jgi:NAD-dependent DNA ligase
LDGISALLYITSSETHLYTRGDGNTGQDITHIIDHIQGIPTNLSKLGRDGILAIRGELIITKTDFDQVKSRGANARNMVAGVVNAKKPDSSILKLVNFIAYSLVAPNTYKPSDAMAFLIAKGFNVVYSQILANMTFENLSEVLVERRSKSMFEVDGIVVAHDEVHPLVKDKNPPYAFAFKNTVTQETVEVIVRNVTWNASKDGYLIPIIEFDPVHVSGVMIKKATGINGEFIKSNGIGPGARVILTRAGFVIPQILRVITPAHQPQMPEQEYAWTESGKDIYIPDASENKQVRQKNLENFFVKLAVPGMKEGTIAKLFNAGYDTVQKIITANIQQLTVIDGFQIKSAEKIVNAIKDKLSTLSCVDLMDASNAFGRGFGSKRLAAITAAIPRINDDSYVPTEQDLIAIEGVSTKTAQAFIKGLPEYREFKKLLKIKCSSPQDDNPRPTKLVSKKLNDQVVVFTGFRDANLQKRIIENGGQVGDSITKKTTILVCKDTSKSTTKIVKAEEVGIKVMDIETFARLFE